MTKYFYTSTKDKDLIINSFNNIAWLVFGKKNDDKIKTFIELFESEVKEVNILASGTTTKYLTSKTPGICRLDNNDNKIIIEMLGYNGSNSKDHSFIKHEGVHEFCHSFADLLPLLFSAQPNGVIKDGILCKNHMGMIKQTDPKSGELVNQHFYGKMFNETMMDIISTMSIMAFENSDNNLSANDILMNNYSKWNSAKTSYSLFTSLTRLTIAAFSNNGYVNYSDIINSGYGIFDIKTKMKNGESYRANDFLYGILFDPLHIDSEFDKFMGEGYYRTFCEYLDRLFVTSLSKQELSSEDVKIIMNILPDFLNKKLNHYKRYGIIDGDGANQIVSNFNQIWNSMGREYSSFFSQSEIDEIEKRAKAQ